MKALILCAGLGTRLRPLTNRWPKPAVPMLGVPMIRYMLARLKLSGVTEIFINTHHLPIVMKNVAERECRNLSLGFNVHHEPIIQGTGGALRGFRRNFQSAPFFMINGDILFGLDFEKAMKAHSASNADATMVLMPMPENERYASVDIDSEGLVKQIAGAGPGGTNLTPMHFSGVHVLNPTVFEFLSDEGEEDINRSIYIKMLKSGLKVQSHVVTDFWPDVGTPARYLTAQSDLLAGQLQHFPEIQPDGEVVHQRGTFVDRMSRIEEGAQVNRCALLSAVVHKDEVLSDVIAFEEHRIPAGPRPTHLRLV